MTTVTSRDGTKIAYDRTGSGAALVIVNGALAHRAFDPGMAQIVDLLGRHFTVYNYDRRGRGESGDTPPFATEREVEDVQALVGETGGGALALGFSSGCAVTLDAAAVTPGISRIALYEPPFCVDDSRPPVPADYVAHLNGLIAEGRRGDALRYFMTEAANIPAEYLGGMEQDPSWEGMLQVAHTIAYDGAFVADLMQGRPLPAARWAAVSAPTCVIDGGSSAAWFHSGADALADVLGSATRQTLAGQDHQVRPEVLVPALVAWFKGG